jgi:acyl-CoA thioesterase
MSAPASFFLPDGDGFRATEATRGPWSADHQHGGPPSALLARELERAVDRAAFRAARMTVEFLRPIPIDRFRVEVTAARDGKKVKTLRARLVDAQGRDVAAAEALFIRRADVGVAATSGETLRAVEECDPYALPIFGAPIGYHTALEGRRVSGTFGSGKMTLWMRMVMPLLSGEEPSPLQRVMIAADSGNGISVALDLARYTFVNPDLTVYLVREPAGEWVGMHAQTTFGADGIGLAETRIFDESGAVGRGLQSLIVERRPNG